MTTPLNESIDATSYYNIYVDFLEEVPKEKLPSELKLYVSSEKNAYGVTNKEWTDGDIFEVKINAKYTTIFSLRQETVNYIRTCSEDSFYECWAKKVAEEKFDGCPKKCLPISLPIKVSMYFRDNCVDFYKILLIFKIISFSNFKILVII